MFKKKGNQHKADKSRVRQTFGNESKLKKESTKKTGEVRKWLRLGEKSPSYVLGYN